MPTLEFRHTNVYRKYEQAALESDTVISFGGSGSSKTVSWVQYWIDRLSRERGKTLSIVRKHAASLHASITRDFFSNLGDGYDESKHRKNPEEYRFHGNLIEFIGIDEPQKKRGARRDYLYVNEMNELSEDDWDQLAMRTRGLKSGDFNPSDEFHWIWSNLYTDPAARFIHSTFRDNPYLSEQEIEVIERFQITNPAKWKVFGLGERAAIEGRIYTNWEPWPTFEPTSFVYGLDTGIEDPTALYKIGMKDGIVYVEELIYESGVTNRELMRRMKALGVDRVIYPDIAEKNRVLELQANGFQTGQTYKGPGSVEAGISWLQDHVVRYVDSPHVEKEFRFYTHAPDKTRPGKFHDWPADGQEDHAMDSIRYGAYTHFGIPAQKVKVESVAKRTFGYRVDKWGKSVKGAW